MTETAEPRARRTHILADLTPLRTSPAYRRLWFGNTVSWIGQGMTALAVSLQVYDITGSAFSVGLIGFCSLVPLIVFGLYGGAVADTVDRRKLGLFSALGSFTLSVVLVASALVGVEHVGLLYAIVALQAVCFALNAPARASMIARLLPAEQLPAANALTTMTSTTGTLVGPMLGGLIVGWWGYRAAYTVDAVCFTASLYAMWRMPSMLPDRKDGEARKRASVLDGLRFLGTRPNLRMTFFTDLCAMSSPTPVPSSRSSPSSGTGVTRGPPDCSSPHRPWARCSAGCSPAGWAESGGTGSRSCWPWAPGAPPSPSSG